MVFWAYSPLYVFISLRLPGISKTTKILKIFKKLKGMGVRERKKSGTKRNARDGLPKQKRQAVGRLRGFLENKITIFYTNKKTERQAANEMRRIPLRAGSWSAKQKTLFLVPRSPYI